MKIRDKSRFFKNFLVFLSAVGVLVAVVTSIRGCKTADHSLVVAKNGLAESEKSNSLSKKANEIASEASKISKEALENSKKSNDLAKEANEISRTVSGITNRPYILYKDAIFAYGGFKEDNAGKSIKIFYNFFLVNKGTLPAWVYKYSFYVSGKDSEPIYVPYAPQDKPMSNFTLGQDDIGEGRSGWFSLMQKSDETDGHVDIFSARQNKFILLITKYKSLGRELDDEDFTYWELFIFKDQNKAYMVEAGTSLLVEASIEALFQKQDKRFSENDAL